VPHCIAGHPFATTARHLRDDSFGCLKSGQRNALAPRRQSYFLCRTQNVAREGRFTVKSRKIINVTNELLRAAARGLAGDQNGQLYRWPKRWGTAITPNVALDTSHSQFSYVGIVCTCT
jgi:hypothetical protein